MVPSAHYRFLLLGVGLLAAAEPAGPALPGVPLPPIGQAAPADTLPAPRTMPTGPPREEPAPAPREQVPLPRGGLVPPKPLHEEAAPMPQEQTPAPPRLAIPGYIRSAPPVEVRTLHQEIEGLRMESEALLNEQMALLTARDSSGNAGDSAQLRRRISELLTRAAQANRNRTVQTSPKAATEKTPARSEKATTPPAAPIAHPAPVTSPNHSSSSPQTPRTEEPAKPGETARRLTDAPIDPLTLAQTLFLAGDHEGALKMYRQLEKEEQKAEDRVTIQYMTACCLRKLGKTDEAAMLFREVANSGGGEALVENAQWHLRVMKERRELEAQLEELRQRRQSMTPRKP